VVALTPLGRSIAAGEGAALVAGDPGQGLSAGGDPFGAAVVQNGAGGVGEEQVDRGLVGQPQSLVDGQQLPERRLCQPGSGGELVGGEGEDDLGRGAGVGELVPADRDPGEVVQGVVQPLGVVARVGAGLPGGPRRGAWGEGDQQQRPAGWGEPASGGVAAVGFGVQGEAAAAALLGVIGEGSVGVQVGQDPLADRGDLPRAQGVGGLDEVFLGQRPVLDAGGGGQLPQRGEDHPGVLGRHRAGGLRCGQGRQQGRQRLAGEAGPWPAGPGRLDPVGRFAG